MESTEPVDAGNAWAELAARIKARLAPSLRLLAKLERRWVRAFGQSTSADLIQEVNRI